MNKHSFRWLSLFLSLVVMVGSLTYIAAGFNAAPAEYDEFLKWTSASAYDGVLTDGDDIISTDPDRMTSTDNQKWSWVEVIGDDSLVTPDGAEMCDVYLDLASVDQSAVAGGRINVAVTMENTTANDVNDTNESVAVDVESFTFNVSYDATYLTFDKGSSNIEGVTFTNIGAGKSASVQVSYTSGEGKSVITAQEMPVFNLTFTAAKDTVTDGADTSVAIDSAANIVPAALKVGVSAAEDITVYKQNANTALAALDVEYKSGAVYASPDFDPQTEAYFITLPYDAKLSDVNVKAIPADTGSTVTLIWSASELEEGINTCTVRVTGADRTTVQDYTIVVKKLSLDTLADPKTTITKTVEIAEPADNGMDRYKVDYVIEGKNDILAGGNDYVVFIAPGQVNRVDIETIRANTANLKDSTLTVIDMSAASPVQITYDLSTPLPTVIEKKSASADTNPAQFMALNTFSGDNQYLILAGAADSQPSVVEKEGYTEITLPDTADMNKALDELGFDNTAAEFVIVIDFSSAAAGLSNQPLNNSLIKSVFGVIKPTDGAEASSAVQEGIPGYVQQIKNMLSNDSTAKVTLIAIGADIGAGEIDAEQLAGEYGLNLYNVAVTDGVLTDKYQFNLENSLYQGQTYLVPQAGNEFWGILVADYCEQHNIWEYSKSFTGRVRPGNSTSDTYDMASPAGTKLLAAQYADAMERAKVLLDGANNPQLIVLAANQTVANTAVTEKITADTGIETTIIPVSDYAANTDEYATAKSVYEDLVFHEKESFNCNPADNNRYFQLADKLNRKVYQIFDANYSMSSDGCVLIDKANTQYSTSTTWYLPAIGEYNLRCGYLAGRWSDINIETETHYYPISNTVMSGLNEDGSNLLDDIPTIAPSYDDEYKLSVTKAVSKFDDQNSVIPNKSEITYVLLYTNTGVETLTKVGISDDQIMLAKSYNVYILNDGKLTPDDDAEPENVTFTRVSGNKGDATIAALAPGQTIYVEYTLVVPEKGVTPVTEVSAATADAPAKYAIENTATGAAEKVNLVQVELDVEFTYSKESGGTVSTSNTSSSTSTTRSTTAPTTTSTTARTTTTVNLPLVTSYKTQPTTTRIIYKDDVSTGDDSGFGNIVAISLLFGAIGVFSVTVYGIALDKKIQRARANNHR